MALAVARAVPGSGFRVSSCSPRSLRFLCQINIAFTLLRPGMHTEAPTVSELGIWEPQALECGTLSATSAKRKPSLLQKGSPPRAASHLQVDSILICAEPGTWNPEPGTLPMPPRTAPRALRAWGGWSAIPSTSPAHCPPGPRSRDGSPPTAGPGIDSRSG